MLTAYCHSRETGWVQLEDAARISDLIGAAGNVVWAFADIATLTKADVDTIAEEFGLHELAVEDAMSMRQRPKLEAYEGHLFTVMHQLDTVDGQLEAFQISSFIGQRYVLTLHSGSERTMKDALARCQHATRDQDQGASFVMHALLDAIVDDYQQIADELEADIEEIEEIVLRTPRAPLQNELYSLKQRLARFRRYLLPGERVLASVLEPGRFNLITDRTAAHFRDIHDHQLRVLDQIRNVQELVDAVLDLQRSEQTAGLNEITKRLTGWAAIIAVPTLIASLYGMNFALYPREGSHTGFIFAVTLMVTTSIGLYIYFKRRTWI